MSTAAQPKADPKGVRRPAPARPSLLVAATHPLRRRAILDSLQGLRATAIGTDWEEVREKLEPGFAALIIAEPLPLAIAEAVDAIRKDDAGARMPLYAVIGREGSTRKARSVYAAGATAAIEWPREREILAGILAETMGMSMVRGHSRRPDLALSRTIRAHLRLGPRPGSSLRVSTVDGVVTATGEARSLAELQRVVETVASVPGVKQVLTNELRVAASGIPDRTVKKRLTTLIDAAAESAGSELEVAVRNGRVELRGSVPSRARFQDLLDLVASVRGVRDLDWDVEIPGRATEIDSQVARRLRRALDTLHPEEAIDVSVLAGVAVLSGQVSSLATKRAAERQAARDDGVERVVNKLMVTTG